MGVTTTTTHTPRQEMSLEEWAALPEDNEGELVDGRLVEEEAPEATHESIVAWLVVALWSWVVPRGGFVFGSELKLAVRARRGRKPDLAVPPWRSGPAPPRHRSCAAEHHH